MIVDYPADMCIMNSMNNIKHYKCHINNSECTAMLYDGSNLDEIKQFCPLIKENFQGRGSHYINYNKNMQMPFSQYGSTWIIKWDGQDNYCSLKPDVFEKHFEQIG